MYARKGEWDKAIEHYEESLEISERSGDIHGMALAKSGIAAILLSLCYEDMNQEDKAYKYFQKYEELRKQLGIENL